MKPDLYLNAQLQYLKESEMPNNKIYKYIYIKKNVNFQIKYSILTNVLLNNLIWTTKLMKYIDGSSIIIYLHITAAPLTI